jgi:transcriptional regulator with XRE-family HTH domain
MPASKRSHVLAILRDNLSLKQNELAQLAGCSPSTIQSIELNRLAISPSLAARISAATGADLNWLQANDLSKPMPARRALALENKLFKEFINLIEQVSLIPELSERMTLALYMQWELNRLKSVADEERKTEEAEQRWVREQEAFAQQWERDYGEKERQFEREQEEARRQRKRDLAKGSRQTLKKPKASVSKKVLAHPAPKAPRRIRRSA